MPDRTLPLPPTVGVTRTLTMPTQVRADPEPTDGAPAQRRGVSGIGVPWDTVIDVWGVKEQFARGSIETDTCLLCYDHGAAIGKVTATADGAEGWEYSADLTLTRTVIDEVLPLLEDGVLTRSSVRFTPLEWHYTTDPAGDEVITYTRAYVREVSLATFAAYDTALLTEVRSQPTPTTPTQGVAPTMAETTPDNTHTLTAEVESLRGSLTEMERRVALVGAPTPAPAAPTFGSYGEFIRAFAQRDERALTLATEATRAFTGATTANVPASETWVKDVIDQMQARQPITQLFDHTYDLPATGMTVDYATVTSRTVTVAEQVSQGDTLAHGLVTLGSSQAPVKTYGGYSTASFQLIERSSQDYLGILFTEFAYQYAAAVERGTRATLLTGITAALADTDTDTTGPDLAGSLEAVAPLADMDATDWLETLIELAFHAEDTGRVVSTLVASKDVFMQMARTPKVETMLGLVNSPGLGALGTLDISVPVEGRVANLRVIPSRGLPAGSLVGLDRQAVRVQEAPGAPFRLTDQDITNLTRVFSVYGYAAHYVARPQGIIPVTFPVA